MSREQDRDATIVDIGILGDVHTPAPALKFDITSDLGIAMDSGPGDGSPELAIDATQTTSPVQDFLDTDPASNPLGTEATPITHPASDDSSAAQSQQLLDGLFQAAPDGLSSSLSAGLGMPGFLGSDFSTPNDTLCGFDAFQKADVSGAYAPAGSFSGVNTLQNVHLNAASLGVHAEHSASPAVPGASGGDPTGELWLAEDTTADGLLQHINSDGANFATTYTQTTVSSAYSGEGAPLGLTMVGLDTADNLYFTFGADDAMTVGNISTGAVLNVTQLASYTDEDAMLGMAVDPFNHTIYISLLGADYENDGGDILKITYNPSTGALSSPYNPAANGGSGSTTVAASGILIDSTTTGGVYGLADGMWLSPDGSELYYADDNGNNSGGADFEPSATNGIYKVATSGTNPQPVLLSPQFQFPVNGSEGYIVGVVVDPAKDLIYFVTDDRTGGGTSVDALWYIPITDNGSVDAVKVAGVTLVQPDIQDSLAIDENAQTLYVYDDGTDKVVQVVLSANGESAASVNSSFISYGSPNDSGLYYDSLPVLTLSSTATAAVQGGGTVNLVSAAPTVTLESTDEIASATITIANAQTGDDLYANGAQTGAIDGLTISWSSSTHTLTLSGVATGATYATVLDEITYQDTGTDTATTGSHPVRTFDWAINDGITLSDPVLSDPDEGTTTITINRAPVAAADSYNATENTQLVINAASGVQANDTNLDGGAMTSSVVTTTADGILSLAANGSFTYTPNAGFVGDDTFIYKDTETSDSLVSNIITVTIGVAAGAPTVGSSGTVTFDGGSVSPVTLDSALTLSSAVDITGATVKIEAGYTSGDVLNFTTQNGISGTYGAGTLTLTGTATAANYQAALESVTYSFSPSDGDPTNGGGDTSRMIAWQATNSGGISNTGTSTLTTVHVAPTVTSSGTVDYTAGGAAAVLDSGLTLADPDSGNNLTGATIKFGGGEYLSGDTLNFTTQNGISGVYGAGVLTLSGTASILDYQQALDSITYTFTPTSGDPTNGETEPTRTIDWTVTDGVASSTTGTSMLDVSADVAPAVSSLTGSATSGADFASGYTATFTLDVSKGVTVAGGTTLSLSDGGTAIYSSGSGTTTVTFTYDATDAPQALTITGISAGSIEDSAGKSLPISGTATANYSDAVTDFAVNVSSNFDSLDSAVSYISSITLNNGGTPNLDLTVAQALDDTTLIGKIVSSFNLVVNDSASNVASNVDSLESDAANISSIVLNNGGTPTLDITAIQESNDHTILSKLQGPYELHVTDVTGESYSSYNAYVNASTVLTEAVLFNTDSSQTIVGFVSGLSLSGTASVNTFDLQSAPDVTVTGSGTTDYYYFGSALTASDSVIGDGTNNIVILNGDYSGGLTLGASTFSGVQELIVESGHSYNITANAATVGSGDTLSVYATSLGSGDSLTFDGSAVTNGNFAFYLGAGTNTITDGSGNDTIYGGTGTDTITLGSGTDTVAFTTGFTVSDSITGGGGTSTLVLDGNYSSKLTFNATTISGIHEILLIGGHSYNIATAAANDTSGQTLEINATNLGASDILTFNGSANAGAFDIYCGAGQNAITGGTGADIIHAAGADIFIYPASNDVTSSNIYDTIDNINFTNDAFRLHFVVSAVQAAITTGGLSGSTFQAALTHDLPTLGAHDALLFTASSGSLDGDTFLIINDTGVVGYHTGDDLVIRLAGTTGTLTTGDFTTAG